MKSKSRSENEFRHFEKMMKQNGGKKEKNTDVPLVCRVCPYYQPKFRYRICSFTSCKYDKENVSIFRKRPLSREKYKRKEKYDRSQEKQKKEEAYEGH